MKGKLVCMVVFMLLILSSISYVGQNNTSEAKEISKEKPKDFIEDLEKISEEEGWTFTVGENPTTKYDIEDLCGLVEPEDWQDDANFVNSISITSPLPAKWDWRNNNGVTPIKNQGACGSCWAFGIVGVLESVIKIKSGDTVDLSEQWLVSCNEDGWGCNGGWWTAHSYHAGRAGSCGGTGAVLEVNFPYTATESPCNGPYPHHYLLSDTTGDGNSWNFIGGQRGIPSVEQIKHAIITYGPVGASVYADEAFQAYTGGVFNEHADSKNTNHAILLVGWDDNQGKDGVWILKNSWGPDWGEDGYMRIEYGSNRVGYAANYIEGYKVLDPDNTGMLVTLKMHKLTNKDMDPIDLFDAPEWYYRVGVKSNGKTVYQTLHNNGNPDEPGFWWEYNHEYTWNIDQDHVFYTKSPTVEVTIKLMDYDNLADDLADVSAYPGGGSDDSTKDKRAAIYHGTYDLRTDELKGDKTKTSGDYMITEGDGKNNAKVWFSITDAYDLDRFRPRISARPDVLEFKEVSKGSTPKKNIEIFNTAPEDPFGFADKLEWSASVDKDWITLSSRSGSVSSGGVDSDTIKVTVDTNKLTKGSTNYGYIEIESNDKDNPYKTIKVSVSIKKARAMSYNNFINLIGNLLHFPS